MPEISRFFGVVVGMFYVEHGPAHFHARTAEFKITVEIERGLVRGEFPASSLRHVLDWMELHRAELLENWERARQRRPLNPIEPLR